MTWKERLIGIPLAVLGAVLLGATAAAMTLTRTDWGREQVRAFALDKLNGAIRGRIEIDAVLEGDLFRWVRLAGVRLYEPDGREFARVDTVAVRYRWADMLVGDVTLQQVALTGPVVQVRALRGGGFNFEEIFRGRGKRSGTEKPGGGGPRIVLRDVAIRSGDVSLLLPWDPRDPRELEDTRWHVKQENGGWSRVFRLERLSAQLPLARVAAPGAVGRLFRIAQLTCLATVIGEPFDIEQLRADLELHGDTLSFDLWAGDLADSRLFGEGRVTLAGDLQYDMTLSGNPITTRDVMWLMPWLPPGVAHLDLKLQSVAGGIALNAQNARWESPDARFAGRFGLRFDDGPDGVEFDDLALDIDRLDTELIASVTDWEPPTRGEVSGRVELDGRPNALRVDADLRLFPEGSLPSRLTAKGRVLATAKPQGAEDLELQFDTLQLELVRAFVPGLAVTGELSGSAWLDGQLAEGLRVRFDIEQRDGDLAPTRLAGNGTIQAARGAPLRFDMRLRADTVSLSTLARYYPAIPIRGDFSGVARVVGPLDDLQVEADLAGAGGSLRVDGDLQLAAGAPSYAAEVQGRRITLPGFRPGLPRSDLDFNVQLEGTGVRLAEVVARGRAQISASFIGGVQLDSASADLRIAEGRLSFDSAVAVGEFGELHIGGALALEPGETDSLRFELRADSLGAFNAWLAPAYGPLASAALTAEGADPGGEAGATAALAGSGRAWGWIHQKNGGLALRARLEAAGLAYGDWSADSVRIEKLDVGREGGQLGASADAVAKGVGVGELRFSDLRMVGELVDTMASVTFDLLKPGAAASGRLWIGLAEEARTVGLDALTLRLGASTWELAEPAQLRVAESGALAVRGFTLRSGAAEMLLNGSVGVSGPASFTAQLKGVELADLAKLWSDSLEMAGTLELSAELSGAVRDPTAQGRFEVNGGQLFGVSFSNFAGTLDYGRGTLALDASMWSEDDQLFRVHGTLPLDLTLPDFGLAIPERAIDLQVGGDNIPLTLVRLFTDQIDDVRGHARAALRIRGTPRNVDLQGPVGLVGGGFRFIWSGIDYSGLEGQLVFDGTVMRANDVRLRGTQRGRATINGTVDFRELDNPEFALRLDAEGLPGYDQLDARVIASGPIELSGRYDEPVISGNLRMVHGVLYLEELGRRSEIVDPLSRDPVEDRPIIERVFPVDARVRRARSPFMENLTIRLTLKAERDTWLRSNEANVEITGSLDVHMQPAQDELRIDGTLEAVRGDYRFANKRFEVVQGTIEFVGTPAMNPNLRIVARYTVRTQKQPIEILLVIGGTLEDMTLSLQSDAQPPIPESDLLSYLLFGRPSYELTRASDEGSLLSDFTRGVPEALVGYALGSLLVGESGIAFVDVSRVELQATEDGEYASGLGPALSATQVEVGWYLAPTVFVSFAHQLVGVVRPTARLEWRLDERFTVRAITEPRFGREGVVAFEATGTDLEQSFGLFLFYGWAY